MTSLLETPPALRDNASSVNTTPPIDTSQPPNSYIGLSLQEQRDLFTNTFNAHLDELADLREKTPNSRAASRISNFFDAANEAIDSITKLKLLILEVNDPKNTSGCKEEDEINLAHLYALTALNTMYVFLGTGGKWYESEAGVASQKLAGGVARYLDFVKAQHVPKSFPDDEEDEGEDGDTDDEKDTETEEPVKSAVLSELEGLKI